MRYGLIGEKLGHSFSKVIHEALCDYTYDLIELAPDEVDDFMRKRQFAAINVTIPYKEVVMGHLTTIDPAARAIGAVNTIVNVGGELHGYNTDFAGIEYMLGMHNMHLSGKKVLILGSGGTCKTALAVAGHQGAASVHIASRNPSNGQISYEQALRHHNDADVIINTTPVGMFPAIDFSPIDLLRFPSLQFVVDVIYNPMRTRLLLQAEQLGIPCCNGLQMLVAQAKYAAEHFTGKSIPDQRIADISHQLCTDLRNVALIGMPSCGKSTTGAQLAAELGKQFVDIDVLIAQIAGMSIPEIFRLHDEKHFRAIEKQALRSVCGKTGLVISCGGGIVVDEDNIRLLRHNSTICFLARDLEKLLAADPTRPLSSSQEAVNRMYRQRLPLYDKYSDFTVHNNGAQADAVRAIKEKFYETACH